MSLPPSEIPLGAMRFNFDSQKLEYWMGSAWMQIQTFSPNLAESGDAGAGVRAIVGGGGGPSGLPDEVQFFNMATGYASPKKWNYLSVAPNNLRNDIIKLIENEIKNKKKEKTERYG